jgi:phosphatidylglycerol:prolipoprotein diacylglycerol transferase
MLDIGSGSFDGASTIRERGAKPMPFPNIDPVLLAIGPFVIRWYALAYIAGLLLGWWYMVFLAQKAAGKITRLHIDDFLVWATLGVILGGRLGYVLFYDADYYFSHPMAILAVWRGGMSFHGGLLGVAIAMVLYCRARKLPLLGFADLVACAAPIGLFFGRLANFINGELFGRPSDVPWAVVFPAGGPLARHPSQLYEAGLEGLVLGLIMAAAFHRPAIRARAGMLTGLFLIGYGLARIFVEFFRQPDPQLGFLWAGATMGQLLSAPMILAGLYLVARKQ